MESKFIIRFGFSADEHDGSARKGMGDLEAQELAGTQTEIAKNARDQIFETVRPAKDLGSGEIARGKMALEGLNQAALQGVVESIGGQVLLDRLGSCPGRDCFARGFRLPLQIQQRSLGRARAQQRRELHHVHLAISCDGDGAVGRAEVNTDGRGARETSRHVSIVARMDAVRESSRCSSL